MIIYDRISLKQEENEEDGEFEPPKRSRRSEDLDISEFAYLKCLFTWSKAKPQKLCAPATKTDKRHVQNLTEKLQTIVLCLENNVILAIVSSSTLLS